MNEYQHIKAQDQDIYDTLVGEEEREHSGLEMIPSENYVSKAVREANGSAFTNKYSEGYPHKRYYGGQDFTDPMEELAIARAKELFNCDHANVQPHSGAPANIAVFGAWLEPGDTVLGMHLEHGGHLTHGHPVTHMAKFYNYVRYEMKDVETGEIDYEQMREMALEHKPKIILAGFSAYSRELDYQKFVDIANEVGALAMADMAHIAGLIAGGVVKNPFDYGFHVVTSTTHKTLRGPRGGLILSKGTVSNPLKAPEKTLENIPTLIDRSVFPGLQGGPHMNVIAAKAVAFGEALQPSFKTYGENILKNAKAMEAVFADAGVRMIGGGTSNHLILADVAGSLNIGGKAAEEALDEVGITLNKNSIPFDERKPFDPSGIRFGTPAMTTRKMGEGEATRIAEIMIETMQNAEDVATKERLRSEVKDLCHAFPVPDSFID